MQSEAPQQNIQNEKISECKDRTQQKFDNLSIDNYEKMEKTFYVEYRIIKYLLKSLSRQGFPKLSENSQSTFLKLYKGLSNQIGKLHLYDFLNYALWNDQNIPMEARDQTKFYIIVSNWIISYELQVGKLQKNLKYQIQFLRQFFHRETRTMFEKIILFNEIYEDLLELLEPAFWVLKQDLVPTQYKVKAEDIQQIIKFLTQLCFYHTIFIDGKGPYMNSVLSQILPFSSRYKSFMLNAIQFCLKCSSVKNQQNKNGHQFLIKNSEQTELTRIILTFLQRPDLVNQQIIETVKLLMLHTSKVVRFAMVIDYCRFYDYLQKIRNDQVLQALQQLIYFRELIIGRTQIDEAGLIVHTLGTPLKLINIPARSRERIYFSHQRQYGQYSILQIQVLIETGDINLILWKIGEGKEEQIWKQVKSEDRRIDILLREVGLYALQFNNLYSWIKSKSISYKVEQYGFFCSSNNE